MPVHTTAGGKCCSRKTYTKKERAGGKIKDFRTIIVCGKFSVSHAYLQVEKEWGAASTGGPADKLSVASGRACALGDWSLGETSGHARGSDRQVAFGPLLPVCSAHAQGLR